MIEYLINNKDLIGILAGIGTFVASLIAIFTLIEVKKQRLATYKPDILIKSFLVAISKSPLLKNKENELLLFKTMDFNDYSKNYDQEKFNVNPHYKVNNLGFGVAKKIKCTWKFDYEKAIKFIQNKMSNEFAFNYNNSINTYFLENLTDEDFHLSFNTNFESDNIDYISPINVQDHFHLHTIPRIIIIVHYLYLQFDLQMLNESAENFHYYDFSDSNFPNLKLEIQYQDLNNKKHKKNYTFKVEAVATQIDEKLDLTREFSHLTFEIIK